MASRRIAIEVEVPEGISEGFVRTLKEKAWELYLIYKWLQLPEAGPKVIEELSRLAKTRAAKEKGQWS